MLIKTPKWFNNVKTKSKCTKNVKSLLDQCKLKPKNGSTVSKQNGNVPKNVNSLLNKCKKKPKKQKQCKNGPATNLGKWSQQLNTIILSPSSPSPTPTPSPSPSSGLSGGLEHGQGPGQGSLDAGSERKKRVKSYNPLVPKRHSCAFNPFLPDET